MTIPHPSLTGEDATRADELQEWLLSCRPLEAWAEEDFRSNGSPRWFRRLHSELLLLTSGETIEAVFVTPDLESFTAEVTVITTNRIAQAHVVAREDADGYWAKAISRRGVREVSVEETLGIIGREARREWPGNIALTVHLAGAAAPLRLAPSVHASFANRKPDMHALLTSFLTNLSR